MNFSGTNCELIWQSEANLNDNFQLESLVAQMDVVVTVAGSTSGYANGVGTAAKFQMPIGITVDNEDNVYVADSGTGK